MVGVGGPKGFSAPQPLSSKISNFSAKKHFFQKYTKVLKKSKFCHNNILIINNSANNINTANYINTNGNTHKNIEIFILILK